jgi:glutathione S-transferase
VVLSQSGAILDYLSRELDRFGPANEDERREILRWLLWDNHKLTSYVATYRFMSLFQKKSDDPVTQFFHARAMGAWKVLDAHLGAAISSFRAIRRSLIFRSAATCSGPTRSAWT